MWFLYGVLGGFLLAGTSVLTKRLTQELPVSSVVSGLFIGMSLLYFGQSALFHWDQLWPGLDLVWIPILAGIFSCIANNFDYYSMKWAPNAGLSTAIKSSQVIFVAVLAVPLLGDRPLLILEWGGICLVMAGVCLIAVSSRAAKAQRENDGGHRWLVCAFLGALFLAAMVLAAREASKGMPVAVLLAYLCGTVAILNPIFVSSASDQAALREASVKLKLSMFGVATLGFIANLTDFLSIQLSPNPGLATALKSTQVPWVAILAVFMLRDRHLNATEWMAIVTVMAGTAFLALAN